MRSSILKGRRRGGLTVSGIAFPLQPAVTYQDGHICLLRFDNGSGRRGDLTMILHIPANTGSLVGWAR